MDSANGIPKISVVLATYNRAETLRRTLRCIGDQTLPSTDYEVIVVDDGSTDHTAEVAADYARVCAHHLLYLQHPNRGPGYTQNRGILAARGRIILLMADDIFMTPEAFASHLDFHRRHPEHGAVALGCVRQSPELTDTVFLRRWDPFRLGNLPDDAELPYHLFWACNISCKRDFMYAHGMFRDAMGRAGAAAHEDVELGYRLHAHGLQLRFCRAALGYHHHVETLDGTLHRSYQRGLNWLDFRRRVAQPEIDVRYRVYNLATLIEQRRLLHTERRPYLLGSDRFLVLLALRYVLRTVLFNRFTVDRLWLPLFKAIERNTWLSALSRDGLYRGVVLYYFLKGCRDGGWSIGSAARTVRQPGG